MKQSTALVRRNRETRRKRRTPQFGHCRIGTPQREPKAARASPAAFAAHFVTCSHFRTPKRMIRRIFDECHTVGFRQSTCGIPPAHPFFVRIDVMVGIKQDRLPAVCPQYGSAMRCADTATGMQENFSSWLHGENSNKLCMFTPLFSASAHSCLHVVISRNRHATCGISAGIFPATNLPRREDACGNTRNSFQTGSQRALVRLWRVAFGARICYIIEGNATYSNGVLNDERIPDPFYGQLSFRGPDV